MNKRILIVDDEPALLGVLVDKFRLIGFDVIVASNGKKGLKSALENHPDLVLLDIIMPVMDGITMLDKLREDSWGKNVKVIFLTNLTDSEKVTELVSRKVNGYLVKSDWKLEDVVKKVTKELEK